MNEEEEDIRERDALASRIRERDRRNKRRVISKSEISAEAEAAKRLKIAETTSGKDHDKLMKKLRDQSRRDYLPKRAGDKLYEGRRQLEEDEMYFPDSELTERELRDRQTKRKIIEAADKYDQAGTLLNAQR